MLNYVSKDSSIG